MLVKLSLQAKLMGENMKIIITGCGKVGYTLAQQLEEEGHDITLIDNDPKEINKALSVLDVQGIEGSGTSYMIQKEAGIDDSDLMIAVTDRDEVNMLCCLMAKKAGDCRTIARVRNPEYYREITYIKEELGLSLAINPEMTSANEIAKLIQIPSALEVSSFARGRINLIKLTIPNNSRLHDMTIVNFSNEISRKTLICAIERDQEVIIPSGQTILKRGDNIYIVTPMDSMAELFAKIGINSKPIRSAMIVGGSRAGYYLAKMLEKSKINVTIIDKDPKRCQELSEMLDSARIICADATDRNVLLEEGIRDQEAFISLTDHDEENIMLSLFANKTSQAKIITKVNRLTFDEVIEDMPIGTVVSPKKITAQSIIQYVRSLQNSMGSNIDTLYKLLDNRVEALEFSVKSTATNIAGKPLAELNLKKGILVCGITRNDRKIITPTGKDTIEVGDKVIVVTTIKGLTDIKDILE